MTARQISENEFILRIREKALTNNPELPCNMNHLCDYVLDCIDIRQRLQQIAKDPKLRTKDTQFENSDINDWIYGARRGLK